MKLLHYLIPFTFAACGTTTEQPSGCQRDFECKTMNFYFFESNL